MNLCTAFRAIWLMTILPFCAAGQNVVLVRHLERAVTATNTPIQVTLSFTNHGPLSVRGFYCSEQLPAGLTPTPISVVVNGNRETPTLYETGWPGDVLPEYTPQRWILERPPNFLENQPLAAGATGQIIYALSTATPGSYALPTPDWVGRTADTNLLFGTITPATGQWLTVIGNNWPATLQLELTNGTTLLAFPTDAGVNYVIERRSAGNNSAWTTLTNVTGTGLMLGVDLGTPQSAGCFFRLRLP